MDKSKSIIYKLENMERISELWSHHKLVIFWYFNMILISETGNIISRIIIQIRSIPFKNLDLWVIISPDYNPSVVVGNNSTMFSSHCRRDVLNVRIGISCDVQLKYWYSRIEICKYCEILSIRCNIKMGGLIWNLKRERLGKAGWIFFNHC